MLIKYVRNKHGHPYGCVVAMSRSEIGWSLCCKRDRFKKTDAIRIASDRAVGRKEERIPFSISSCMLYMKERAKRYFKDN